MIHNTNKNQGFALVALLITFAIITIMATVLYGRSGNNKKTVIETGNKAIEQTK